MQYQRLAVFLLCSILAMAGCGSGGGGTSTDGSGTDTAAPIVPTGLDVTAASASQINLSWSAATDAVGVTGYKIYRGGSYLNSATGTSSSDTGLTASTLYCYQVSAYDAAGNESNKSLEVCATTAAAAPGANFKMPDTNQTTSYTTTFGEDHDYTINPPSYTDNGDGTVTDNVTGLIWQKQDDGVGKSWAAATTYCDNLTLGGQTDWRLPSRIELVSILDYGIYVPSINATFFPSTISSSPYWSSTSRAGGTSSAWSVGFSDGSTYGFSRKTVDPYYARCVRGGQAGTQSLTDNGNGTVTDSGALLMWQQGENYSMTWEAALSYCEGLSLAGYTDWRLPNIKELSSLVDDTKTTDPAINTTLFPNTISSAYWSSTTVALTGYYTSLAYYVSFGDGHVSNVNGKTNSYYARCVRGGQ